MKKLDLLDYGRFFAAMSVVGFHYLFNGIANGKISSINHIAGLADFAKYGYFGVEFFFMISGYVIFFSAKNRSAKEFAVSRALRLYPAFWFAVLFTSCVALFLGGQMMSVHPMQVAANLTMAAPLFGQQFVDGVYWTLILELNFYLLIFSFLLLGLSKKLEHFLLLWPLLISVAVLFNKDHLPLLGGYYSYFSAGCIFAIMKERITTQAVLSLLVSFVNCLLYSAGKGLRVMDGHEFSVVVVVAVITLFFLFFICLNTKKASGMTLPKARLLGGLTYPLYLIHAHVGYMLISRFATEDNKGVVMPMIFALVLFVAYLIHTVIERRFASFWKTLFQNTVGKTVGWANCRIDAFRFSLRP